MRLCAAPALGLHCAAWDPQVGLPPDAPRSHALPAALILQAWAVPDATLRDALRDALSDQLLPLFQAFHDKYRGAAYTGERGAGGVALHRQA